MTWHLAPLVVAFDCESTGVNVETDRIVTASYAIISTTGATTSSYLINPGVEISAEATAVHGITTEQARTDGRPPADVLHRVTAELATCLKGGDPIVGMNLAYDLTILDRDCRRHGVATLTDRLDGKPPAPVIDVMVIDRAVDRYRPGKRTLTDLCTFYGVRLDGAHDATFDALAAARLAWRMGQRAQLSAPDLYAMYRTRRRPDNVVHAWRALGRMTLDELHTAQVSWYAEQADSFDAYLRRERETLRIKADDTDDEAARELLYADMAALDARIDSVSTVWPYVPLARSEVPR
jgi:DNA polymerase-3 subunit epsilon